MAEEFDFLAPEQPLEPAQSEVLPQAQAAEELLQFRGYIVPWASQALLNRCPQARAWRGAKGHMQARLDMDSHLKQLHQALLSGPAHQLLAYRAWWPQVLQQRSSGQAELAVTAAVFAEALYRFLPDASAAVAVSLWRQAFPVEAVATSVRLR